MMMFCDDDDDDFEWITLVWCMTLVSASELLAMQSGFTVSQLSERARNLF